MRNRFVRAAGAVVVALAFASVIGHGQTPAPAKKVIAIKAAHLIDGQGGASINNAVVVI